MWLVYNLAEKKQISLLSFFGEIYQLVTNGEGNLLSSSKQIICKSLFFRSALIRFC